MQRKHSIIDGSMDKERSGTAEEGDLSPARSPYPPKRTNSADFNYPVGLKIRLLIQDMVYKDVEVLLERIVDECNVASSILHRVSLKKQPLRLFIIS